MTEFTNVYASQVSVGDQLPVFELELTPRLIVSCAIASQDFQDVISEDAPEVLPDPLIDAFSDAATLESSVDAASAEPAPVDAPVVEAAPVQVAAVEATPAVIDFPTVASTAGGGAFAVAEDAEPVEDSDDDGDMGGMADLMMLLPFVGLLAVFM